MADDGPRFTAIPGFTDRHGAFPKTIVMQPRWQHTAVECPDGCQRVHLAVPASVWKCSVCGSTHDVAATRVIERPPA